MPESNKKDLFYATAKTVFLCACFFLLFAALFTYIPKAVDTISNTIADKKLPIYCVKTDKPQVALSFDAAWGDGRLMEAGFLSLPLSTYFSGFPILRLYKL